MRFDGLVSNHSSVILLSVADGCWPLDRAAPRLQPAGNRQSVSKRHPRIAQLIRTPPDKATLASAAENEKRYSFEETTAFLRFINLHQTLYKLL